MEDTIQTPSVDTDITPTVSEDVNTPGNGRTAQERIRELAAENKELKARLATPAAPAASAPQSPAIPASDEDWKRKVELEISVPTHLKDKVEDMTAYWGRNPGMTRSEVFKLFTPVDTLVAEAKRADDEATQSRSGGSSNPAARQEQDISKLSTQDLRTQLEDEIKRGVKI